MRKTTDRVHNLISSGGGQDTSVYTISGHSLHAFCGKCPETSQNGRADGQAEKRSRLVGWTKRPMYRWKEGSLGFSEAVGVSSLSLVPQIERIMVRSLWRSRCSSGLFAPDVSIPWSIAERTNALYTLSHILGKKCWLWQARVSLIFPGHTTSDRHGTFTAPTGAQHINYITESDLHTKHGAVYIHFSHSSAIDGPGLAIPPAADIFWVGHQSLRDATALLVDPPHAP